MNAAMSTRYTKVGTLKCLVETRGIPRDTSPPFSRLPLKSLGEIEANVSLAKIGVRPCETSATAGNNVSYAPGLLRPFLRMPPVL